MLAALTRYNKMMLDFIVSGSTKVLQLIWFCRLLDTLHVVFVILGHKQHTTSTTPCLCRR